MSETGQQFSPLDNLDRCEHCGMETDYCKCSVCVGCLECFPTDELTLDAFCPKCAADPRHWEDATSDEEPTK